MKQMGKSWYSVVAKKSDKPAEVSIYDEIGIWGVSAKDFIQSIRDLEDINLTIHSPGGEVADGLAIYNAIKRHRGKVVAKVDTMAASMASVIALAADEVEIAENGFFMVHAPWIITGGNADELEKMAEDMRKFEDKLVNVYEKETNLNEEEVRSLLKEDSYLFADEAVELGFADRAVAAVKAAAKIEDFRGDLAKKLKWPTAHVRGSANKHNKEKNMSDNNDKLLDLQAKVALAQFRDDTAKIVDLGKSHGQLELAVKAIAEGTSLEDFKGQLLDAYAQNTEVNEPQGGTENIDPSAEPKTRDEFLATYRTLSGRMAGNYYNKYKDNFLK